LVLIAALGLTSLQLLYGNHMVGKPIRSDGVGYYIYLPGVFLYQTLSFEKAVRKQFGEGPVDWAGLIEMPETRRYMDRYGMGEAILMLPFFAGGHLWASLTGAARNGFSPPYQTAAALSGLFYVIVGLYVLKRALAEHFSSATVTLTIVVMTFATNLFHYATCDNIFTHGYSFFLFSLLLWLIPRWHKNVNWRYTIAVAIACGLITLVRQTNALYFVFVLLLGIDSRASLRDRARLMASNWREVGGGIAIYAMSLLPLLLYWKFMSNHWLLDPYGVPLYFTRPQIVNVLFSVRKGLYFWSPILLLATAGFCWVERYWKGFVLPAALFLIGQIYLVASWEAWAFGGSFGHRAFTEGLVVFAVGYASFVESARGSSRRAVAIGVASFLCVALSLKLMVQYWLGIIPYDETTWAQFSEAFFKFTR
jgi:hypothetical protein